MKKLILKLLIVTLSISAILPGFASAESNENIPVSDTNTVLVEDNTGVEYEVDVEEELGLDLAEDIEMTATEISDEEVVVSTEVENEDTSIDTELFVNSESGEITLSGHIELENGEIITQHFDVVLQEIDGTDFIATLIDQDTGESYQLNTIDAQASVLPAVIIGVVAKHGIKYAIKKFGKKLIVKSIKSSKAVLNTFAKAAVKAAKSKVSKFDVSNKHLKRGGGNYAKFNTTDKSQVRNWIKEGLNSKNASYSLNPEVETKNADLSFVVIANLGKVIGTKGQKKIKIVVGWNGKIWTAYPIN
ncbi:SAR2788 family putative toxin [Aeribacillus pallidus]|nr:SAR2788 family putative toxin [Aeribacillus pallidus]